MSEHIASWKQLSQITLDLLFPLSCVGCGKTGFGLCLECRGQLPRPDGRLCPRCGLPMGGSGECRACQVHPLAIDVHAPFRFDGVVRLAVHSFKYRNYKALAAPLADLLSDYWQGHSLNGDVLLPVPLHPARLRRRGYNQSELLARELGKRLGLPVVSSALVRIKNMPAQAKSASAVQRWANAARAFTCSTSEFKNRRVVLVDDVCTTGATLDSAGRAILSSGAASAWGLAVAREI